MVRCVANLTDDLVAEILSRLPTKSFSRFQCVSKSWYALSHDACYRSKFPRAASGLFFTLPLQPHSRARIGIKYISFSNNDDDLAIDTAFGFLHNICNMQVLSSCNGLLLCESWVSTCGRVEAQSIYVCNPATREWVVVPKANDTYNARNQYLALGFDPRISRHYHVLVDYFDDIPRFMIFSTQTNEWVVTEAFDSNIYHDPIATFFDGIFHVTNGLNQVLGIDPEGKFCRRIELPESSEIEFLGHSEGYLHYVLRSEDEMKVWMLKDYRHVEWVLKYSINIRTMLQNHGIPETQVIDMLEEGIDFLEFHPDVDVVFLGIQWEVFSYHLNRGRLEKVSDLSFRRFVVYSPCLLKGFGDEVA